MVSETGNKQVQAQLILEDGSISTEVWTKSNDVEHIVLQIRTKCQAFLL